MFAALNGVGLALLVPCCQSLIADLYPAEQRGRAFGTLQLTASFGGMLGGVFATNMGGHSFAGMDGWRAAFHTVAALSLIVGEWFVDANPAAVASAQQRVSLGLAGSQVRAHRHTCGCCCMHITWLCARHPQCG